MSKKKTGLEELMELMAQYDPVVNKLAWDRAFSRVRGGQLFDYKTRKLKPHIRDEAQAIAILTLARKIAEVHGFELKLSADCQQLLDGYGKPNNGAIHEQK